MEEEYLQRKNEHRKRLEGHEYKRDEPEKFNRSERIVMQSIVCILIFAMLFVIKLVNSETTKDFIAYTKNIISNDKTTEIQNIASNFINSELLMPSADISSNADTTISTNIETELSDEETSKELKELTIDTNPQKTDFKIDSDILKEVSKENEVNQEANFEKK